ncbi:MAG: S8 family peptidase [Bacteroidales bacterium]|nr:S8 family peptidase [Bacteroidales bacterium]
MKNLFTIAFIIFSTFSYVYGHNNKLSINTMNLIRDINNSNNSILKSSNNKYSEIGAYIIINKDADPYSLEEYGVKINMVIDSIVSARIPLDAIDKISALDIVKKIDSGGRVKPKMDKAREAVKVNNIINSIDLPSAYSGKDVVIGIIDCGVQLDHINFFDSYGNLRIKRVWNQPVNSGTPPEGFSYGSEYKTQEEIIAAGYDDTSETHGNHVIGIAAGSYKDNDFYGVAPESDIVFVSYNYNDMSIGWSSISDAIGYIYDYADSVGKPCVINISLGDTYGPHDGCSIFDQVCDALQGEGKLIVGSAGNEGSNRQHIKKTFTSEQDSLRTFVSLLTKYGSYYATQCDFYGEHNKEFKIKACIVKASNGNIVNETGCISSNDIGTHNFTLSKVNNIGANASIQITSEIEPGSSRPHICVMGMASSVSTGYTIGFKVIGEDGSTVHAWVDDYYSRFTNKGNLEGWTPGDLESNIAELGGTGKRIISVGSYKTKVYSSTSYVGEISSFSSVGPTLDGRMKPDITAPGEYIVSSFSNSDYITSSKTTEISRGDKICVDGIDYYWGAMRGTSMSSPMVAGTLALWLEANPNLTPEDVRDVLKETAIRDSETGSEPNNTWGYGKLDAWNGLKKVLEMTGIENDCTLIDELSTKVFARNGEINVLFTKDINNCSISIYDITGKCINNTFIGNVNAGEELSFNKGTEKGIYIIKINGDNLSTATKLIL